MYRQFTTATTLLIVLLSVFPAPPVSAVDPDLQTPLLQEPNWDRDLALKAASEIDVASEANRLLQLASRAEPTVMVSTLSELVEGSEWPEPAREATLYRFTQSLRELPPFSVDSAVLEFLLGYQNKILVAHEEVRTMGVPLYPIRAAAHGLVNQWKRQQAATKADEPESRIAADGGTIEEWTEQDGVLGLGYPVPIPVDTPLPFDGFRSYNGLHTRHQDLAASTEIVHGEVVGTTHAGREIWAYRIGDDDLLDREGRPEPATLTNGGIHAREWQTPEVVTGIMELFAERQGDNHFYDFLLENVNIVLLPVQNVDGFLQTQRYPSQNWLGSDPFDVADDPQPSPRDGRMRRKNMPGVDEILTTYGDHLFGIDLNRNNPPLWSTDLNRSSPDNRSLVYHGEAPHSEPEAQALVAAAELGPVSQLRAFTDVHSFSQVFYFHRTSNRRLSNNTIDLLHTMANHNAALPNGTLYLFNTNPELNINQGFGMTNEFFTTSLGIPSWGVEVEPSSGQAAFPDNPPGCGADYGGLARNCHDGFILPESQIRRVREELARSFTAVYYQQAGPPSVSAVRKPIQGRCAPRLYQPPPLGA